MTTKLNDLRERMLEALRLHFIEHMAEWVKKNPDSKSHTFLMPDVTTVTDDEECCLRYRCENVCSLTDVEMLYGDERAPGYGLQPFVAVAVYVNMERGEYITPILVECDDWEDYRYALEDEGVDEDDTVEGYFDDFSTDSLSVMCNVLQIEY